MSKKEKTTEIQVEVPLTKETATKISNEFIQAFDLMDEAESDIKEYVKSHKEDAEQYDAKISEIRYKIKNGNLSGEERATLANEVILAMNRLSEIDDDIKSYKAEKQAEIAKCEAIMNICRIQINRGKNIQWVKVRELKDFVAKTKTYFNLETGEAVKTLSMNDDDLQLEMEDAQ
ncbi:MAG: hypothetical protein WC516_08630 [Patescibacteria group bacterium]